MPSAVAFVHRDVDVIGDGAANSGCIFIGPRTLPHARCALVWFIHHGFSVRLEYFPTVGAEVATSPGLSTEIPLAALQEGEAILASTPAILDRAIPPRAQPIAAPGIPFTSPFPVQRADDALGSGGNVSSSGIIISPRNINIDILTLPTPRLMSFLLHFVL